MKNRNYIIFYLCWVIFSVGAYVGIPEAVDKLGFLGSQVITGEYWRIFLFPLIHLSNLHLLENLIVLLVLIFIAIQLDFKFWKFVGIFLLGTYLVGFLGGFIWPYKVIVGSSIGLFALFGALAIKGRNHISPRWSISAFLILMILNVVYKVSKGESIIQEVYHSAGLLVGLVYMVKTKEYAARVPK